MSDEKRATTELEKLATRLENCGLEEYIKLSQRTWKILWLNFLSGVARGLGFTVGTAIVLAIAYKVLKQLISMNIPYLTEVLKDVVELIKNVQ
ncbi:MAG: hypothetical protein IJA79_03850 [Desulfovibrio sp.]|nr:hypothetical protein [Desulfovibrio sp.]